MKYGIFRELYGYTRYSFVADNADAFMGRVFRRLSTSVFDTARAGRGRISFSCMRRGEKELCEIAEEYGITLEIIRKTGIAHFLSSNKKRLGIATGLFICTVLMFISERLIWEIRVSGNVTVSSDEIVEMLSSHGFHEGIYYPSFDLEGLYYDYLLSDGRISWIAINIKGTVALVEVRERAIAPERAVYDKPVNLVAARDGEIVRIDALAGGKEVKNGDFVTKGDLLISSFFETRVSGNMFQSAKGHVFAKTERVFDVTLPHTVYEKRYTGKVKRETATEILGKKIGISKVFGVPYEHYDISHEKENLRIFGDIILPIRLYSRVYSEFEVVEVSYTEDELRSLSYDEIYAMLGSELSGADILETCFEEQSDDSSFTLRCRVVCVEDIAREELFEFDGEEKTSP